MYWPVFGVNNPSSSAAGDSASTGTSPTLAHDDHVHGRESYNFQTKSIIISGGPNSFDQVTPSANLYPVVSNGIGPAYSNKVASICLYAPLPVSSGGTGLINVQSGAVIVGTDSGSLRALPVLTVASGGTGVKSLPDQGIVIGNGSDVFDILSPSVNLYPVVSNGFGPTYTNKVASVSTYTPISTDSGGTGLTSVPNHMVLIGTGGGSLRAAAVSVSTYVFQSLGQAFDPDFRITPTGGGGTGQSLLLNNNLLAGSGDTVLPVQLVPPVTQGFVLTDNGPGALPGFALPPKGRLTGIKILTNGTKYMPTAGTTSILVECIGGGGAGGGCPATNVSNWAVGGGGGGGGYVRKYYAAPLALAPYTYAIGVGGSGRLNNSGNNGGNTTFTDGITALTAGGGTGGGTGTAVTAAGNISAAGGAGGSATGGDINVPGTRPISSVVYANSLALSPSGYSGFNYSASVVTTASSTNGINGSGYGGGGSGGGNAISQTATRQGGNGTDGVIIVWEFA